MFLQSPGRLTARLTPACEPSSQPCSSPAPPSRRARPRTRPRSRWRTTRSRARTTCTPSRRWRGTSCKRKWVGNQALCDRRRQQHQLLRLPQLGGGGLERSVRRPGHGCDHERRRRHQKLQKKSFVGRGRAPERLPRATSLRVLPNAHKWQYFRDPKGAGGAEARGLRRRQVRQARLQAQRDLDPGLLVRRARAPAWSARSTAPAVVGATDSGADQPDGRQTVVTAGAKGSGAGPGSRAFSTTSRPGPEPVLARSAAANSRRLAAGILYLRPGGHDHG